MNKRTKEVNCKDGRERGEVQCLLFSLIHYWGDALFFFAFVENEICDSCMAVAVGWKTRGFTFGGASQQ